MCWVLHVYLSQEQFTSNFIAIPLLFHVVPTTTRIFILSWDHLRHSPLIKVRVLCYEPASQVFPSTNTFKHVATNIFLQHWQKKSGHLATNSLAIMTVSVPWVRKYMSCKLTFYSSTSQLCCGSFLFLRTVSISIDYFAEWQNFFFRFSSSRFAPQHRIHSVLVS
jgi:hypothetical protein